MNWRRGLKRLLVVGYVVWAGFIFVWVPLEEIKSRREGAFVIYRLNLESPGTNASAELTKDLERATWGAVYPSFVEEIKGEPVIVVSIFLVPLVAYGILFGLIYSGVWLVSGFRRDVPPSP